MTNQDLVVRRLELSDEAAFLRAVPRWDQSPGFMWTVPTAGQSFSDYVSAMREHERGNNLPVGYVSSTPLFGFLGGEIVARANFRHELNDFLFRIGGHIGYGVLPEFRRRGFAKAMLRAALGHAWERGLERVLVTCDDDNVGSARTIEALGGQLENILDPGQGAKPKRRYWIVAEAPPR